MTEVHSAEAEQFFRLMSLHKYWLNADFLRDVFMRRLKNSDPPAEADFATTMDNHIAMSLWYATVYVVIEGSRGAGLSDPDLDVLLADDHVDHLRRFRNQIFHYQEEYDNPKLLEFLGENDDDAEAVTTWIRKTHAALGKAIETAIQANLDSNHSENQNRQ
ncbi:hypothetical protein ACWKWP_05915 [Agromyces soli]